MNPRLFVTESRQTIVHIQHLFGAKHWNKHKETSENNKDINIKKNVNSGNRKTSIAYNIHDTTLTV